MFLLYEADAKRLMRKLESFALVQPYVNALNEVHPLIFNSSIA